MNKNAVGTLIVAGCVGLGFMYVMAKVQRSAHSPDFERTVKMGFWRGVKGFADTQSVWWGELGLRAGTNYNRARL